MNTATSALLFIKFRNIAPKQTEKATEPGDILRSKAITFG